MKKKEKLDLIVSTLESLFPNPTIPLLHTDPFTLLIAVVLSAQCTDKRVNEVTPRLFAQADTPHKMVALSVEEIREIIKPCGLSTTKSKALKGLSEILIEKYQGQVPADLNLLKELPGVGHKTASVVVIQGFGQTAFPVDTHIHRLGNRWKISKGKSVQQTEKDVKAFFPPSLWNKLHLQMIYFARGYCPARGHDPKKCPICKFFIKG